MAIEIERAVTSGTANSVTLPYAVGTLNGLYAVLMHAAKDDKTPSITAVRVDSRAFVATDRYTVGRWVHSAENEPGADSPTILVPRSAAEWLTKQLPKILGKTEYELTGPAHPDPESPPATMTFTPESITVLSGTGDILAVSRFDLVGGNFPPVARLMEKLEFATDALPVAIAPKNLDKFSKGVVRVVNRDAALTMTFTGGSTGTPGPVYITFGEHFDGLMQPVLLRR